MLTYLLHIYLPVPTNFELKTLSVGAKRRFYNIIMIPSRTRMTSPYKMYGIVYSGAEHEKYEEYPPSPSD